MKKFLFLFLLLKGLFAEKVIVPYSSYVPPALIENNKVNLSVLKEQEPLIYKWLKMYLKCKHQLTNKNTINVKKFNKILNSKEFTNISMWYTYHYCETHPNQRFCENVLRSKIRPKKPKCLN